MEEVERKILNVSIHGMEEKVKALGASQEFYRELFHAYWLENQEWVRFRIRQEWVSGVRFEHKEKQISGYQKETGIEVKSSLNESLLLAQTLWFWIISETKKYRTQWTTCYKNHTVHILIDEIEMIRGYEGIPSFAEIETDDEEILFEVGTLLGYQKEQLLQMNESRLLEYYKNTWEAKIREVK